MFNFKQFSLDVGKLQNQEDFSKYPGLLKKINLTKITNSTNGKYDFRYGEI